MSRYRVKVMLSGVDPSQSEALAAKEQAVVGEFVKTGFIEQIYVRKRSVWSLPCREER